MANYLTQHWQGKQSLAWSFWINLVAIRVAVFGVQNVMVPPEGGDYSQPGSSLTVFILVFVFHAGLLVWQLVGVVRAADNHFAENGNMAMVWGAQLGGVLLFMLTAVYALGAIQMTMKAPLESDVLARMSDDHASRYEFEVSADGRRVTLQGSIELGITRAFKEHLMQHPNTETVILDSAGGNIYEGRGLAIVFSENRLATHVQERCASACTIAFVGGVQRTADAGAAFGFHQYRIDADYTIIATDVKKEQQRDQQLLLDAGVSAEFVDTVFSHPSESMWWPPIPVLESAGFLRPGRIVK